MPKNTAHRSIIIILILNMLLSLSANATENESSSSFPVDRPRTTFTDVPLNAWFYEPVYTCQETGILIGNEKGEFLPLQQITAKESFALFARLHQQYTGASSTIASAEGPDWSTSYLNYCIEHRIIANEEAESYSLLTREIFVRSLSRIFDFSSFTDINPITNIIDYDVAPPMGQNVLKLYRAGILSGINEYGSFSPNSYLTRAECAAIIARIIRPDHRIDFSINENPFTMELVFLRDTDEYSIYDFDGKYLYLTNSDKELDCEWYVTDLYGRKILQSHNQISPQHCGIFTTKNDSGETLYYDLEGTLIYRSRSTNNIHFEYGILPVRKDNSMQIIDTKGDIIKTIDDLDLYYAALEAFGGYIPVIPDENRVYEHSYLLDMNSLQVYEKPYALMPVYGGAGTGRMVIRKYSYGHEGLESVFNVIDTSLNELFPFDLDAARIYDWGCVLAKKDDVYYILDPDGSMKTFPESEYGEIVKLSPSGRMLHLFDSGLLQVSDYKTGQIVMDIPNDSNYLLHDRTITRIRNENGITVIDILDENGNTKVKSIPVSNVWYGGERMIYKDFGRYYFISA